MSHPMRMLPALLLALAPACRTAPGAVLPEPAGPATRAQVVQWVQPTIPAAPRLIRFKWLFRDDNSSAGGRGSARIAPPDSLRFDISGPFGSNPSAAAVVGDSALWVQPEDAIKKLVPNYPLMWALLGVARMPADGASLRGVTEGDRVAWEYALGSDTIAYARTAGPEGRFLAEVREAGKLIGRVETTLGSEGEPKAARLTVPSAPARLDITFLSTAPADSFDADVWRPRAR